jgi:WD40 repeat protein
MTKYFYQVGGSLGKNAPTYVERLADQQLYQALVKGEFCYVFNSRQMGKSSLLVQTRKRLEESGYACTTIDLTKIGSENITPSQWYKGIITELWQGFNLIGKFRLKSWWPETENISDLQNLSQFIESVILANVTAEKIFILVDEIDSILGLDFPVDDFFALIRFCYNQRATNPEYHRLSFALFGVATPSDLIQDKSRTPFNIGTAIDLGGFTLEQTQPLLPGLEAYVSHPENVLKEILAWTNGQPFLTQKLCKLVAIAASEMAEGLTIEPGREAVCMKNLVKKHIIHHWESQDEPEHLRTIRDRLNYNEQRKGRLLGIYQQILQGVEVHANDSKEHTELVLSGLVVKHEGYLQVKNQIYANVFNQDWAASELGQLRPYSQTFDAWIASQQRDESRLLRGQALKDAQIWSQGKSLSDLDYQFLAASVELDRKEVKLSLEAERIKEVEARLYQEKKSAKRQKFLLSLVSFSFLSVCILAVLVHQQYHLAKISETHAKISEIKAISSASKGFFASEQKFDALIEAIRAKQKIKQLGNLDITTENQVNSALRRAVYGIEEYNRLSGHKAGIVDINFSPNGQLLASASADRTIKLWHPDGSLWKELKGHQGTVWSVQFSPDSDLLVSGSEDNTIKLWNRDGILLKTFNGHQSAIMSVAFSPDGKTIASASLDGTVKLWNLDGTILKTFSDHSAAVIKVAFSPDGQTIVSGSADNTIKLWHLDGTLLQTFAGNGATVWTVRFSPDGKMIGSASWDKTIKIWDRDGSLLTTLRGHQAIVWAMAFSPDSSAIASGGADNIVKLWKIKSPFLTTLPEHTAGVWGVAFSPDNSMIASASWDKTVKLWNREGILLKTLERHQSAVFKVVFSPNSQTIATSSADSTIKLWNRDGTLLNTLKGHRAQIFGLAFSPDGEMIVSASADKTIKLWTAKGTLLTTLKSGNSTFASIAISPNSQSIAVSNSDGTVKIWNRQGTLLKTIKSHPVSTIIVTFSPNGQILATGSVDHTVKLWKLDGTLLKTLADHQGPVWGIAFSPDGQKIATGSLDNTVKIWKIDGTLLVTLEGHTSGVRNIAFSPDGKTIASASDDNTVILWDVENVLKVDLLQYGCDWVRDYLRTNVEVEEKDRHLCDGIKPGSKND